MEIKGRGGVCEREIGRRPSERDRMRCVRAREAFRKRNGDVMREGREGKNQIYIYIYTYIHIYIYIYIYIYIKQEKKRDS